MADRINSQEVDELLDEVRLPATADELATAAEERGASSGVISFFESLAPETMFTDRSEILNATEQIGGTGIDAGLSDDLGGYEDAG